MTYYRGKDQRLLRLQFEFTRKADYGVGLDVDKAAENGSIPSFVIDIDMVFSNREAQRDFKLGAEYISCALAPYLDKDIGLNKSFDERFLPQTAVNLRSFFVANARMASSQLETTEMMFSSSLNGSGVGPYGSVNLKDLPAYDGGLA